MVLPAVEPELNAIGRCPAPERELNPGGRPCNGGPDNAAPQAGKLAPQLLEDAPPMASHALSRRRPDPIDLICAVNRGRSPTLLARKFAAMAADRFAFLRASAMLGHRAIDLAALPASPLGWVCGDLHLQNFGCFRGGNRLVYFDLNDFDEAARLPVCVDLLRFLGSIHSAAPGLRIARAERGRLVAGALSAYAAALARGKAFWLERETASGPIGALLDQVDKRKRRSLLAARTHCTAARRHIAVDGHRYQSLVARDPARRQVAGALEQLAQLYGNAGFFRQRDVAFRVAGMGSLGIPRYVALVRGKGDPDRNALIDFKFAVASSAAQALPQFAQPAWASEAARVVAVQDACQAASPAYLSAAHLGRAAYVVRELQPAEDRIALAHLARGKSTLAGTLQDMAALAAFAQLRSAGRLGAAGIDALMAFGRELQARAAPWTDAARAIDAANTDAYAIFARAWRDGDPRLLALCDAGAADAGTQAPVRAGAPRRRSRP
jgi:uncharacterized protein (DUF2252 family)